MIKIIPVIICLIGLPVWAACDGGEEIIGVENGHKYCASIITMNWWSAHSWCRAQGRHLTTYEEACGPDITTCCNMKVRKGKFWLSTPKTKDRSWYAASDQCTPVSEERAKQNLKALCY